MIIVSRFKDFYDFVQYEYGQDENIFWKRNKITDDERFSVFADKSYIKIKDIYKKSFDFRENIQYFYYKNIGGFDYISILGNVYPIGYDNSPWCKKYIGYMTFDLFKKYEDEFIYPKEIRKLSIEQKYNYFYKKTHFYSQDLYNLSYFLRQPIIFHESRESEIRNDIPNFTEYKGLVSAIGDPYKLYRDIYNFFIDVNNTKEEKECIDNNTKIHKAGFDIKKSFRKSKEK